MSISNIESLVEKVIEAYKTRGFSEKSIRDRRKTLKAIQKLHQEQGLRHLNSDVVNDFISTVELRWRSGKIGRIRFVCVRCVAEYLLELHSTGEIQFDRRKPDSVLTDYYENLLLEVMNYKEWGIKARKSTVDFSRPFFRWLQNHGYADISKVDIAVIRQYLVDCSTRMKGRSIDSIRRGIKKLYHFLFLSGYSAESYSNLLTFYIPYDKPIKMPTSQDEIAAILSSVDRNTAIGKRDYAILILGTVTGLRSIDIAELTLSEIDWRSGEIKIVQTKTGKSLALPLTTDAATAITDYIVNARPRSSSDRVFLRTTAPFEGLHDAAPSGIFQKYRRKLGFTHKESFHGLRRCLATSMVITGTPVTTIAQVLGHSTINSTKQYISLNSRRLKECALDFSGIELRRQINYGA